MEIDLAGWSAILLCFALAGAFSGGLYEHIVLTPIWSASPPSSFAIIQPRTGVPLQRFWIPVHAAITLFLLSTLVLTWNDPTVRRLLLIALASYVVMRVWSALFFIREMLAFQKIPLDSAPSAELRRGSPDGRTGHGSGSRSTRSRSCAPCWRCTGRRAAEPGLAPRALRCLLPAVGGHAPATAGRRADRRDPGQPRRW